VVNQQWPIYYKLGITKEELVQEGGWVSCAPPSCLIRNVACALVPTLPFGPRRRSPTHCRIGCVCLEEKTKWNKINPAQGFGRKRLESDGQELALQLAWWTEVLETQRKMSQAQRVLSLDYEVQPAIRSGTQSTNEHDGKQQGLQARLGLGGKTRMQADLVAAMTGNLTAREARLMRLRYGLSDGRPRSGGMRRRHGQIQTRVQQLSKECFEKKLRKPLSGISPEYLLTIANSSKPRP
jgi:hypothetical protein